MNVRIALPLPLDQTYTYRVPAELQPEAQIGCRVLVPFGKRMLTGCIVDTNAERPGGVDQLKDVRDVLDDRPALTPELLRLTRWMAQYYVCSWGEVVKAALPPGTNRKSQRLLTRTEAPVESSRTEREQDVLRYLASREDAVTLSGVRQAVGDVPLSLVRGLQEDGLVTMEKRLSRPKVKPKRQTHLRLAAPHRYDGAAETLKEQLRGHKQRAVIDVLADALNDGEPAPPQTEVKRRAEAPASTIQSLLDKDLIERFEKEVTRSPLDDVDAPEDPPDHTLTPDQRDALAEISGAINANTYETFLLHGVTGSGKTEIYIAALKEVLARDQTGIILVPEIALTPQTVRRFRAHFGDQIAVMHSQMSLGERYDTWRHLRGGRYRVVIGPRSAVLAPLSDVGLIVVDEEHESSYKQFDPAPRYHARDVAVMRAAMNDAACILGSATPSLESIVNARRGKYTRLELPERVPRPDREEAAPLPDVRLVDLTRERKKHQLDGVLSVPLREAISERLRRSEQTILLQNRRGYAPIIECENCGFSPVCGDCSVTMTYHKSKRRLRCHYCGRTRRLPSACPKCGDAALAQLGTGTQRVEEELADRFPEATVVRMDRDSTSRKNAHHRLLRQFGDGEADILVGTQMVAKGLDFSRVTLVGVVNADTGLLMPDFRAEEHTFQLLTQVAGRAGRAALAGEVLLQTRNPDNKVLRFALAHDFEAFAEETLRERRTLSYPPFGQLAAVEFRGPEQERARRLGRQWTTEVKRRADRLEVLGPEPALVARVKRKYRFRTILKAPSDLPTGRLQHVLRQADAAHGQPPRGYHVAIDVDAVRLS